MTAINKTPLFDTALIGGGIAGAGIARDAALRGLSVVLFEKNTCGAGTSSKSSRLIHGGLRYLEQAWFFCKKGNFPEAWKNFSFVFFALKESMILERIAKHVVWPVQLIVPIYQQTGGSNIWSVYFGSFFYGLLAFITGNRRFPKILFGKTAVLKLIPNLNPKNLAGGVFLWDHQTDDQRLVLETIRSAEKYGAQIYEHTFVKSYRYNNRNNDYEIEAVQNGKSVFFRARTLVNAGGPWVDQIRKSAEENNGELIAPVAGCHIMLKRFTDHSVILRAEDRRVFFIMNINDHARIGTTERIDHNPDTVQATDEEVEYLLAALERYFPDMKIQLEDIVAKDAGIRPLAKPDHFFMPHSISREHQIDEGPTGVFHVLGVKLTDHRRAAEDVVDCLMKKLGLSKPCLTHQIPL